MLISACFVSFIIGFSGCEESEELLVTRVIKNASSHNVRLEGYFDEGQSTQLPSLNPGDSLLNTELCFEDVGNFRCNIQTLGFDSVKVIFNDDRVQLFCGANFPECYDADSDIISFNVRIPEFRGGYVEEPENTFTYTITDEDYDKANPI